MLDELFSVGTEAIRRSLPILDARDWPAFRLFSTGAIDKKYLR